MRLSSGEIVVKSSEKSELAELDMLYGEAMEFEGFDRLTPPADPAKILRGGSSSVFPDEPLFDRCNCDLLSVYISGMLVGYVLLYRDFPGKRFVSVRTFYVAGAARGKGFGGRILEGLVKYFSAAEYGSLRARVSPRNWDALRFLAGRGFTHILSVQADGVIELERVL